MNKKNATTFASLLLLSPLLLSCGKASGFKNGDAAERGTLALQAVTSARLASSLPKSSLLKALHRSPKSQPQKGVEGMLPTLDLFLENGFSMESSLEEGEFLIQGEAYSFRESVSFQDINGKEEGYSLYYNVILEKEESQEGEWEKESLLKGLATLDGVQFLPFQGKIEKEEEAGEKEDSVSFCIWSDSSSYVEVEESHEEENGEKESEFEYKIVSMGRTVEEFSVERENKGAHEEIEFSKGDTEYTLKKKTDPQSGEILYWVSGEENGEEIEATPYRKSVSEEGIVSFVPASSPTA